MVAEGKAPKIAQTEEGATYDAMIKKDTVGIKWDQTGESIHNFIRGNDKVPGAWTEIDGEVSIVIFRGLIPMTQYTVFP